jgi:transposase
MKDPIGMRPIWHHTERRVRAHIFVAALAFLLDRMLERRLRDGKTTLSSTSAWEALKTIKLVQFRMDGELRRTITPGSSHARHVLTVLGLTNSTPPSPPTGEEIRCSD